MEVSKVGMKFDIGKPRYGLLPAHALDEIVKVLTAGSIKYDDDNWKIVADGQKRYFDATLRHIFAFKRGEQFDPETGLHHLAHAATNLLFLIELDTNLALPSQ